MNASANRRPMLPALIGVLLVMVIFAVLKRDTIASMLLKGGDISLTGEAAQSSPQAQVAIAFLAALRTGDVATLERTSTTEQFARLQQELASPTAEFEDMKRAMLEDLSADTSALRTLVSSVQVHEQKGVVSFNTPANSWFLTMDRVDNTWRVSAF